METNQNNVEYKICNICNQSKTLDNYYSFRETKSCKFCLNQKRRNKYATNPECRKRIKESGKKYKQQKKQERDEIKEIKKLEIGINNKICKYCNEIKNESRFRHNRLKCKDCEREDPKEKFKRYVRTRIYNSLKRNKTKHTVEYLGTSSEFYYKWIMEYDASFNSENYGQIWHIDHVIPLSTFNLEDLSQQLIAFNWRNTMPLSSTENMSKNNRLNEQQIKKHYEKLIEYHNENNIILPQEFIELFSNASKLLEVP